MLSALLLFIYPQLTVHTSQITDFPLPHARPPAPVPAFNAGLP
jgi:hypothetical protein